MPVLEVTRSEGVALVRLNRPELRNAVTLAMWQELAGIFNSFADDDTVRAVILTGAGGHFSVGADVSEFGDVRANREQATAYEVCVDACSDAIAGISKPVIAAISGYCLGGGCHLALAADFRLADHSASLGIPAAKLSIIYGIRSVQRLQALVGIANARRVLFSAERYNARQSHEMGLVDELADDVVERAYALARSMSENAPLSIAGTKYMLNALSMGPGALDLIKAQRLIDEASDSADFEEGRRAFAEKRKPRFTGR